MNRKRVFAFLAMAPAVWSAGQCDANGVCTVKGGLKPGPWWRKELNDAQPLCREIDPQNTGTCHQWTQQLGEEAFENVKEVKTTLSDFIKQKYRVGQNRRVLMWNDGMDELYLSAPKNTQGSDKVFVTPHIDGFVGWIPYMRAWRCIYGLTGPHDTVTVQPLQEQQEITLGPGDFSCFDYNREIHWIENRPSDTPTEERLILKIHFYEYPAIFGYLGELFGMLNYEYNSFARKAFLVSQFPDQSAFAQFVGRVINSITLFGGNAEKMYGYCNAGIMFCLMVATKFNIDKLANWTGVFALLACLLAVVFHSVTYGHAARDGASLGITAVLFTGLAYLKATFNKFHFPSLMMVAAGSTLCFFSFEALGYNRFFYGAELKSHQYANLPLIQEFPYDVIPHPFSLGAMVTLLGLRMHPVFGSGFSWSFMTQLVLLGLLVAVEVFHVRLPDNMDYFNTYDDFAKYHQIDGNVYAHLLTTGVAMLGVLGLINLLFGGVNSSDKTSGASCQTNAPWVTVALIWLVVRYTVPDDDVAFSTVPLFFLMAQMVWKWKPNYLISILLLVAGTAGQEFAHAYYKEETFMNSYADVTADALLTLSLHNIWLVPFEVRATINAVTASLVPSFSPVYA